MKVTESCECPICYTKKYKQIDSEYPIMECENGHTFWSD